MGGSDLKKAKLSFIWAWADKHLKQVRGDYGDVKSKEACALGAIEYYRSNGRRVDPAWHTWSNVSYETDIDRFITKYKSSISSLNDRKKCLLKPSLRRLKQLVSKETIVLSLSIAAIIAASISFLLFVGV